MIGAGVTTRPPTEREHADGPRSISGVWAGTYWALAVVLVLALGARFWGLDWQLPFAFHPDEGHYVWKAEEMFREGHLNPKYFRNPSLFTYAILGELKVMELAGALTPRAEAAEGLLNPPSVYVYLGRATSALLGTLSLLVAFAIGRAWAGPGVGAVTALFLGLDFLHVRDSHYATNDVPAVALALVSVWLSFRGYQTPRYRTFVLAALLGGLATSAKYSMGLYLLPLVLAWGLARAPGWTLMRRLAALAGAGVASLAAYLVGTPYTLITWDKFLADFRTQMRLGAEGWEGQSSASVPQLYLDTLLTGVGWPLLLLAIGGVFLAARRDWRAAAILLAFPISYGLFMARQQLFFARFALPLVPFVALFGACAVMEIVRRLQPSRFALALAAAVTIVALAPSVYSIWVHNRLLTTPDTRVVAFEWMRANLPTGAKVLIEDYTIRDRRPRAYLEDRAAFDTDLINANDARADDPLGLIGGSAEYAVISSFNADRFFAEPQRSARQIAFYRALDQQARLIAEFRAGKDNVHVTFDIEDLYTPFWDVQRYARAGPTIKIYALRS